MSSTHHHREQHKSQATPSTHTHLYMEVPQRAQVRNWKKLVEKTPIHELDLLNPCPEGRKPHVYYR